MKYSENLWGKYEMPQNPLPQEELYKQVNMIYLRLCQISNTMVYSQRLGTQDNPQGIRYAFNLSMTQLNSLKNDLKELVRPEEDESNADNP